MKNASGDHNYFSKMPACLNTNSLFFFLPGLIIILNLIWKLIWITESVTVAIFSANRF